jgi:hypothetical protein
MAASAYSRAQRLRKQAERQSLYSDLAGLRKQEASYITVSATIPEQILHQINEIRHKIEEVEKELSTFQGESLESPGRRFYQEAFEAELAGDLAKALKLYKRAARHDHPDAAAAGRSVSYLIKTAKSKKVAGKPWGPASVSQSRNRALIAIVTFLILALTLVIALNGRFPRSQSQEAIAVEPTATTTSPGIVLIVPDTATPLPANTPTTIPTPTNTPQPNPTEPLPTVTFTSTLTPTLTPTPTPTPTLRAAPKLIGPRDGLVWKDGAIVFEFEKLDLAYDELYCLQTLKGYDITNTENWSHRPVGSKKPFIPIEAHVFQIAKIQGIGCIVWSAAIGQETCENIISESTAKRVIGLPRPCDLSDLRGQ